MSLGICNYRHRIESRLNLFRGPVHPGWWENNLKFFEYPARFKPYVSFRNATVLIIGMHVVANAIWLVQGNSVIPVPKWSLSRFSLVSSMVVIVAGMLAVYAYRGSERYYQAIVTIYAILLAALLGLIRTIVNVFWGV